MKKTYKFMLPQNNMEAEIEKSSIRVENGEVVVDVELKEKFEPKDGDFLYCKGAGVFINKISIYTDGLDTYAGTNCKGDININSYKPYWCSKINARYATPEEKSAFLARLENELHKRWNEETKQLEDIRWRASYGCFYFYIDTFFCVSKEYDFGEIASSERYKVGNYFRTVESAQKVVDQIKEIFKNSKAE